MTKLNFLNIKNYKLVLYDYGKSGEGEHKGEMAT